MAVAPHPGFCDCCTPTVALAPAEINNRPGLSEISYRIGTFATFRQSMLNSISSQAALAGLTTRESDDFAITIIELFSAVGDVLTFYNERIANEIFLRTSQQRESVLRLVRLINYQLNPGLAATAFLAFTLDDAAETFIRKGLKVMSVPGQDERPQTFEAIEAITAHGDINDLPAFTPPIQINALEAGRTRAPMVSWPEALVLGDKLVLFGLSNTEEKSVIDIQQTDAGSYLEFAPAVQTLGLSRATSRMARLERRLRFFGHNAPANHNVFVPGELGTPNPWPRWVNRPVTADFLQNETNYPLDVRYEDIKPGTHLLIEVGDPRDPSLRTAVVTTVEDKPTSITVTSGIQNDNNQYTVQEDTVTHVELRQTLRGRPDIAAWPPGGRRTIVARSGTGAILWMTAGGPGDDEQWIVLDKYHLASGVTLVGDAVNDGRLDFLAMDEDGTLAQRTWLDAVGFDFWTTHDRLQTPSGVIQPGQVIKSQPAGVVVGGQVWALARGRDDDLVMADVTSSTPQTLVSLGGSVTTSPAVISTVANRADIFVRGADRALWWLRWNGASFSEWESLGGTLATAPAVASTGPGRIDVAAVNDGGNLIHRRWADSKWRDWENLGGAIQDEPAILRAGPMKVDVLARGADNALWHITRTGPDWSDWMSLDGVLSSGPAALRHAGALHVYARGGNGAPTHRERTASGWQPWRAVGEGIGRVADRRSTRIFQIDAEDIAFRDYDYPVAPQGNRIALRLPPHPAPGLALLKKGRRIMLKAGVSHHLAHVTHAFETGNLPGERADHLLVDISPALASTFPDARLIGNIAESSHGETQPEERLGNGDATQPFQKFGLTHSPLTYIPSATSIKGSAELAIRVDGEKWEVVPSLYARDPNDRVYAVRQDGDGNSVATFGDGRLGARLPTGAANVVAEYRKGLGLEGRVKADQLSIALERPVGLRAITNPLDAEGGADPENRDDARDAAPATVQTLGRAVSLQDFEWIAVTSGLVARADVTWVWHRLERAIHLTVAAAEGASLSTASLDKLYAAMTAARDPNRQLFLANLVRIPLVISAKLLRDPAIEADAVLADARQAVESQFAFESVPLGYAVHASQVYAALQGARGVIAVDLDVFQLKDYTDLTPVERAVRSVTADPLQPHIRIYPARPTPSNPAQIDRYARAGFEGGLVPPVLAAEQAYIEDPDLDINLSVVEAL